MKTKKEYMAEITELKGRSRLHRRVINDIMECSKNYNGTFEERMISRIEDIQHGLSSGIIGWLISYYETTKFFKYYRKEIEDLLQELMDDTGCSIGELLRDWDKEDMFCREVSNQNLLAWFGYEEVNQQLSYIFEL